MVLRVHSAPTSRKVRVTASHVGRSERFKKSSMRSIGGPVIGAGSGPVGQQLAALDGHLDHEQPRAGPCTLGLWRAWLRSTCSRRVLDAYGTDPVVLRCELAAGIESWTWTVEHTGEVEDGRVRLACAEGFIGRVVDVVPGDTDPCANKGDAGV
ncbi:hypothetical protein VCV18_004815 [Metarhizium anisopliae]